MRWHSISVQLGHRFESRNARAWLDVVVLMHEVINSVKPEAPSLPLVLARLYDACGGIITFCQLPDFAHSEDSVPDALAALQDLRTNWLVPAAKVANEWYESRLHADLLLSPADSGTAGTQARHGQTQAKAGTKPHVASALNELPTDLAHIEDACSTAVARLRDSSSSGLLKYFESVRAAILEQQSGLDHLLVRSGNPRKSRAVMTSMTRAITQPAAELVVVVGSAEGAPRDVVYASQVVGAATLSALNRMLAAASAGSRLEKEISASLSGFRSSIGHHLAFLDGVLPQEILQLIVGHLEPGDVRSLARTSRVLKAAVRGYAAAQVARHENGSPVRGRMRLAEAAAKHDRTNVTRRRQSYVAWRDKHPRSYFELGHRYYSCLDQLGDALRQLSRAIKERDADHGHGTANGPVILAKSLTRRWWHPSRGKAKSAGSCAGSKPDVDCVGIARTLDEWAGILDREIARRQERCVLASFIDGTADYLQLNLCDPAMEMMSALEADLELRPRPARIQTRMRARVRIITKQAARLSKTIATTQRLAAEGKGLTHEYAR
jgi:hypothetical protein